MATQRSPTQPKRSAFASAIPSAPRVSTSSISSNNSLNLAVASSPSVPPNTPSNPSSIPTFRSLRSLLPFGPSKNPTPASNAAPSTPHARGPFATFGSVRRSMSISRSRGGSDSAGSPDLPIISIERNGHAEELLSRRSLSCVSFEKDKPLPDEPFSLADASASALRDEDDTILFSGIAPPFLRAVSPGPPISADLSTILEADTSGVSKRNPSSSSPCPSPSSSPAPPPIRPALPRNFSGTGFAERSKHEQTAGNRADVDAAPDTSTLDISAAQLRNQVLDAIMAEECNTARQWVKGDNAVIIDADAPEHSQAHSPNLAADQSFNLDALDPDLAALLSPNRLPNTSTNVKRLTIVSHPPQDRYPPVIDLSQPSPATPQFPPSATASSAGLSPSPSSPTFPPESASSSGSFKSIARSQQSSLPRLRPPTWHSSVAPSMKSGKAASRDEGESTHSGISTARDSSDSLGAQTQTTSASQRHTPAPPSPLSLFGAPSTSSSMNASTLALSTSTPSISARRTVAAPQPRVFSPFSRQASSGAAGASTRPPLRQMTSTPSSPPPTEWGEVGKDSSSPLRPPSRRASTATQKRQGTGGAPTASRPSFDSTPRGSLDQHQRPFRPSLDSFASIRSEEQRAAPSSASYDRPRPSLDMDNLTVPIRPTSRNRETALTAPRARKRSMSVQDRYGGGGGGRPSVSPLLTLRHQHAQSKEEFSPEDMRPTSSLSGRFSSGRRGLGVGSVDKERERPPATEWLGPRTVKAFKAAGLIDRERDGEKNGGSASASGLGFASTLGRFGFGAGRSASEYTPATRAHSRMGFSEAGGSGGGGSSGRRGSGSGTHSSYGLMESPTFTVSSGSRERDTPTTAPTSVGSASPFGFLGREKEREKEEVRELKEKHLTETGALLGALSDSQRTTKMLREENAELRERLDRLGHVEMENEGLREAVGELRKEVGDMRAQLAKAGSGASRLGTWTARRSGLSSSISSMGQSQADEKWATPMNGKVVRGGRDNDRDRPGAAASEPNGSLLPHDDNDELDLDHTPQHHDLDYDGPVSSSTPAPVPKMHKRRFSTTSSIFPAPPANMTMLLHDSDDANSMPFSGSPPVSIKGHSNHKHNSSATSISPITASFSMMTGSPGSLFLRPEHEVHLGDMESLDLGLRSGSDGPVANDDDGW